MTCHLEVCQKAVLYGVRTRACGPEVSLPPLTSEQTCTQHFPAAASRRTVLDLHSLSWDIRGIVVGTEPSVGAAPGFGQGFLTATYRKGVFLSIVCLFCSHVKFVSDKGARKLRDLLER